MFLKALLVIISTKFTQDILIFYISYKNKDLEMSKPNTR